MWRTRRPARARYAVAAILAGASLIYASACVWPRPILDTKPPSFAGLDSAITCIPGPIGTGRATAYQLAWTAAVDNMTPPEKIVYYVYQATAAGGEDFSSPTYVTAPGATSFTTPQLPGDAEFFFVVRAVDRAGNIDANKSERMGQNLCE